MTTSKFTMLLIAIFASCTWIGTNSVWMQLPLFTSVLPEGWNLPAYLAVVVQCGCIAPLIYTIVYKRCKSVEISKTRLIFSFLIVACLCQLGLVFLWKETILIGDKHYSVALYTLLFGLAVVDSVSSVLFMPFMSRFSPPYLNAYFVGMGFSSLIPSILALIQGTSNYKCVGEEPHYFPPRFTAAVFFLAIFFSTGISTITFLILRNGEHKWSSRQIKMRLIFQFSSTARELSGPSHIFILFTVSVINAQMNGIIPSISSFAALPYSQDTYHYSIALSNLMMPLASFLSFFVIIRNLKILGLLSAMSTCATAFLVYLAALSPSRIFSSQSLGSVLSISASLVASGLHSFLRIAFASRLRECDDNESRLFWCGVFTQIGSFTGSMVMLVVNINAVFKSATSCR
uniref:Riboflavin transporter n=1 Tax=Angiostrongylus cantonensis TaxID=6313 RepID=A0A158P6A2_ANGCA